LALIARPPQAAAVSLASVGSSRLVRTVTLQTANRSPAPRPRLAGTHASAHEEFGTQSFSHAFS
jgi:hypothetical protein